VCAQDVLAVACSDSSAAARANANNGVSRHWRVKRCPPALPTSTSTSTTTTSSTSSTSSSSQSGVGRVPLYVMVEIATEGRVHTLLLRNDGVQNGSVVDAWLSALRSVGFVSCLCGFPSFPFVRFSVSLVCLIPSFVLFSTDYF
jgi:hypothetical protein